MFRLCKALLPQMKEGGSVVNTGSLQSFDPSPSLIAYASTKAAIVSFSDRLRASRLSKECGSTPLPRVPCGLPLLPRPCPKRR
jgi:hypothetical protein